jgi:hypothetical protein
MTDKPKAAPPREYFLNPKGTWLKVTPLIADDKPIEHVHVIEYSYAQALVARCQELEAANKVMSEALEFYAPGNSYDYDKTQGTNYIWNDQGKRAREALAKAKEIVGE